VIPAQSVRTTRLASQGFSLGIHDHLNEFLIAIFVIALCILRYAILHALRTGHFSLPPTGIGHIVAMRRSA